MRSSFWFVPTVIVLGVVGVATVLIAMEVTVSLPFFESFPLLFWAGKENMDEETTIEPEQETEEQLKPELESKPEAQIEVKPTPNAALKERA